MKLECIHADTCLPDYWGGHHLPHIQIPVYPMKLSQLKQALKNELFDGAIAGADYVDSDLYNTAIKCAIDSITLRYSDDYMAFTEESDGDITLFNDYPVSDEQENDTTYAFFVFREVQS